MRSSRSCLTRLSSTLCIAALAGCRFVAVPPVAMLDGVDDHALPSGSTAAAKPAPRTIPIDMVFVRHQEQDPQLTDELWQLADEQILPDDVRRRLNANGLRAGIVAASLPPALAARFTAAGSGSPGESRLDSALIEAPAVVQRTLRLLPGRDNEIVAAAGVAEMILLERNDDGVEGDTYRDASAIFALRAWPAADGRVRMQVSPLIKHGPHERSWVGDEGAFRLETGQRRRTLDALRFEVEASSESLLLIGCSGTPSASAGDTFLRGHGGVRLLALRPLARTADPLFSTDEVQAVVPRR
jgi:hypothetical protein